MTEKHLRVACHLPPTSKAEVAAVACVDVVGSQDEALLREEGVAIRSAAQYFARECCSRGWNMFTQAYFNQIPYPANLKLHMKRATLWNIFKESDLWINLGIRGKSKEAIVPRIHTLRPYGSLFATMPIDGVADFSCFGARPKETNEGDVCFPENYDMTMFKVVFKDQPLRKQNVEVMREALGSRPKKAGRKTQEQEKNEERANKLASMECLIDDLNEMAAENKDSARKKRRLLAKVSVEDATATVPSQVVYQYNHDWRSRRFARGQVSAQGMDKRFQRVLLHGTHDLDIENCLFVLCYQMIQRLGVNDKDTWSEELSTLEELATNRSDVCHRLLNLPQELGKDLLHQVFSGSAIPAAFEKNQYMVRVARLGRFMRWLAVSIMPEIHQVLTANSDVRSPEATCFSFMWQAVED